MTAEGSAGHVRPRTSPMTSSTRHQPAGSIALLMNSRRADKKKPPVFTGGFLEREKGFERTRAVEKP